MSTAISIPKTARAAVIEEFGKDLVLRDFPVKQPSELAPGECLIKLDYAGCCHSDIHVKDNDWPAPAPVPLVGGHEGIGHIVAIGGHTSNRLVKIGDRVGVKWFANACLKCEMCRTGWETCCEVARVASHGYMLNGTFSEYVLSWVDYVTPIPEGLDSAAATPILCAGITIYKALKESNAKPGHWVAISGAGGGLGHLGIQYAVAMGMRVVAIDTGEQKKELCMQLGAEKWVDFMKSTDVVKDVQEAAGGEGPHAAIIAVGHPLPFNQALLYLRLTGTLVAVGMPAGTGSLNIPITLLVAKCLHVVGTATGNRQDMAEALDFVAQGKVKCHYEVKDLKEVNSVMADMLAGKVTGRVVLKI